MATDLNMLLRRAEAAFAGGDYPAARSGLQFLIRAAGEQVPLLHLLALSEQRLGQTAEAAAAFRRALALAPREAGLHHDFAHLLSDGGAFAEAIEHYTTALRLRPGWPDAIRSLAATLQQAGREADGLALLDELIRRHPQDAIARTSRGRFLLAAGNAAAAARDFDAALEIDPNRPLALKGSAKAALEQGESDATTRYRRALALAPDDRELRLGLAEALEAEGDPDGSRLLAEAVKHQPDWVEGHQILARMRMEQGRPEELDASYREALAGRPADRALHLSRAAVLASAERYEDALSAIRDAQRAIGRDPDTMLREASYAAEAGADVAATQIFSQLAGHRPARIPHARHLLRTGDPEQARLLLESVITEEVGNIAAWALLGLAWRVVGDPRHDWLSLQPQLWAARDLPIAPDEVERLARLLRTLHRTMAHPLGQSLRGGTQTRGRLFLRSEPELAAIRGLIEAAVLRHVAELPAADTRHPLLRLRDRPFVLAGSWSVRLTGGGFHVSHIHPEGALSSALYIVLPEEVAKDPAQSGWLEIGRPPAGLNLDLPALATIEPKPGRLALFPSYMFHGTRPFSEGERLTIAFDVTTK